MRGVTTYRSWLGRLYSDSLEADEDGGGSLRVSRSISPAREARKRLWVLSLRSPFGRHGGEVRYQHIPLFFLQCNVSERFISRLDFGEEKVHNTCTRERIERPVEFPWSDRRSSEARDHCSENRRIRRHLRDLSLLFVFGGRPSSDAIVYEAGVRDPFLSPTSCLQQVPQPF